MGVRWSRLSWSDRNELWARWRRGESVRQIAYGLRRASSVIHTVVAAEGGITPRPRGDSSPGRALTDDCTHGPTGKRIRRRLGRTGRRREARASMPRNDTSSCRRGRRP